jgi:hypothetical protein
MVKCSMDENGRDDVAVGPVVSGGGRSPSPLSTGQGAPPVMAGATLGPLAPVQRWSVARKREVALRLMRGESTELLSRELGLPVFKLEQWRRKGRCCMDPASGAAGRVDVGGSLLLRPPDAHLAFQAEPGPATPYSQAEAQGDELA